jgi:peptidoglycan/LPS O-acetylase OafA/YrhL
VATLLVSIAVLDPLRLSDLAGDAVAAALSVPNIRFALGAMDYFQADAPPSPLLHYWSLGVEEQFYLVWPTLLILAARLGRPRLAAVGMLATVVVVSYAVALYLTDASAQWAFYSLPTRAWQLALGGLIAVLPAWHERLPARIAALLGWLGLGAILLALVSLDPAIPYPGLAALLPTLGAGAIVLAGDRPRSVGALLATRPLRFLGRISYSLYLVHWPILVLPAANLVIGEELPLEMRAGLAIFSIAVAMVSYRWIEEPFHRGTRFALPFGRTLAAAGVTIAAMVLMAAGVNAAAFGSLDSQTAPKEASALPTVSPKAGLPRAHLGAIVMPPAGWTWMGSSPATASPAAQPPVEPTRQATPPVTPSVIPSPVPAPTPTPDLPQPLPADVRPSLSQARNDTELLVRNGCTLGYARTEPPDCEFGDPSGPTVALVGDSHASQWFPALEKIAAERHWRLVTFTKLSCRFFDLPMVSRELKRRYTECERWRPTVVARLVALHPALTIAAAARGPDMVHPEDDNPTRQGLAMARLLQPVPGKIAILVDTPESHFRVPECISAHLGDVRACQTPRSFAWGWRHLFLEKAGATALGATLVDLSTDICPADPCPVVLDGMIVYRDDHHMTATFAASLAPVLASRLPDPRLTTPGQ